MSETEWTRRAIPEWIGSSPDAKVPPHVRQRIFLQAGGVCHIAKRKIRAGEPWDLDHIKALRDGGQHRESNLAPALRDKHRRKTAAEATERADVDRKNRAHIGISKTKSGGFRGWRKMNGEIVWKDRTHD